MNPHDAADEAGSTPPDSEPSVPPNRPRPTLFPIPRSPWVIGSILVAVIAAGALAYVLANQLTTTAYKPSGVQVSAKNISAGGTIVVTWKRPKATEDRYPLQRILACTNKYSCTALVSTTPNDGRETINTLALRPGRYYIELRALDAQGREVRKISAKSNQFSVSTAPEGGGSGGGGGGSGGGGGAAPSTPDTGYGY